MKLEIAPREYWIKCTYEEAIIYLEFLEIDGKMDWHLPENYKVLESTLTNLDYLKIIPWFFGDHLNWATFWCIPVRDIDHD